MGYELPKKLRELEAYEPVSGEFQIRLDANESFLSLPERLLEEIGQRVKKLDYNRYPDPKNQGVCQAFASLFGIDPKAVMAGNGSDELISLILGNFAEAGEKVLTTGPDFSMYAFYAAGAGLTPVVLEKEELKLDKDRLIELAKKEKCRIVIFSNPCNPSSLKLSMEDTLDIAKSLDCLVVADEAYMDFSDSSAIKKTEELDNLIVLRTCSKAFGLAGIRLGFAVSNGKLTNILNAVKSPYNVNILTQTVGELVLSQRGYLAECVRKIKEERDYLYQGMKGLEEEYPWAFRLAPTETNFVFLKTSLGERIFQAMKEAGIAIRLMGDALRISAGGREENERVLRVLEAFLKKEAGDRARDGKETEEGAEDL